MRRDRLRRSMPQDPRTQDSETSRYLAGATNFCARRCGTSPVDSIDDPPSRVPPAVSPKKLIGNRREG